MKYVTCSRYAKSLIIIVDSDANDSRFFRENKTNNIVSSQFFTNSRNRIYHSELIPCTNKHSTKANLLSIHNHNIIIETMTTTTTNFSLTIRLSSGKRFTVEVPSSDVTIGTTKTTIEETHAREEGAAAERLEASRQKLVYKGRILDDDSRSLANYGVATPGSTLFLVMSGKKNTTTATTTTGYSSAATTASASSSGSFSSPNTNTTSATTTANANAAANPWGAAMGMGGGAGAAAAANPFGAMMGGMPNMGMGGGAGMPSIEDMTRNPPSQEQMQQMMQSPMMQQMMDNPEMMRSALQMSMNSNPQLRQELHQDSNLQKA